MYVFVRIGSLVRLLVVLAIAVVVVLVLLNSETPGETQQELAPAEAVPSAAG